MERVGNRFDDPEGMYRVLHARAPEYSVIQLVPPCHWCFGGETFEEQGDRHLILDNRLRSTRSERGRVRCRQGLRQNLRRRRLRLQIETLQRRDITN